MLSCSLCQILTLPSEYCSRNWDSSDQAMFLQSSFVQFWWACVDCEIHRPARLAPTTIPRSKSSKSPFFPTLMLGLNFSKSSFTTSRALNAELLPCDWLISNLSYQATEHVYLIKWPVSVYIYIYYIFMGSTNQPMLETAGTGIKV